MRIVLDSNFFISRQFDLSAPDFQVLARAVAIGAANLIVPEVVVAEVERKFHDKLAEEAETITKAEGAIRRLTGREPTTTVDLATLSRAFNERFETWRKNHGALVPRTNAVSSDMLVERALRRRKPFKGTTDEGMRDAIIWECLLHLASDDDEEIVLLSYNARDFADSSGVALHPDLLAEAASGKAEVAYFPDMRSLREKMLDQAISEAQEDEDLEGAKTYVATLAIHELYGDEIERALVDSLDHSTPREFTTPSIPELEPPGTTTVGDATGLGPRLVEVGVTLEYEVEAKGFVSGDWYELDDYPEFSLDETNWNRTVMKYTDNATVEAALVVDMSGPRITGFQVNKIDWDRSTVERMR